MCLMIFNKKPSHIIIQKFDNFLKKEYEIIPDGERIGKGIVYISKHAAKELVQYFKENLKLHLDFFKEFMEKAFIYGEMNDSKNIPHLVLYILAEFPIDFKTKTLFIEKWADHGN